MTPEAARSLMEKRQVAVPDDQCVASRQSEVVSAARAA